MSFTFACHNCGRELKAYERAIGRKVRCPECETLLVIPEPISGEAEEDEFEEPDEPVMEEAEPVIEPPRRTKRDQGSQRPHADALHERKGMAGKDHPRPEAVELRPDVTPPPIAAPISAPAVVKPKRVDEPPLLLPPQAHPEDLIDMTAMVDIVFFLLIFFMVTSLQALEAVMNMPTPQSAEGGVSSSRSISDLENDPNYITVRIEEDDSIWVEDTQVFNDQELALRLRTARAGSGGPRSMLVIGDADASHGSAVRVFDAGAGAGVNSISLIIQENGESGR